MTADQQQSKDQRRLNIAMIGLRGVPATYGGVERAVEELSAKLVERGHSVTVYARNAYSDPEVQEHRGIDVIRLPQINTKHAEAASHSVVAVAHAIAARRYDVVNLHATGPGALSPLLRLAGVPTVVTVQGLDWRREKWGGLARRVLRMAAHLSARGPDRTIVVSRELQRHFREVHKVDASYIPNGVEPDETDGQAPFDDLAHEQFVLFLGRLVPEKHVHTLIRAYRRADTDLPLVIAGPDSHSPEYVDELRNLAADDDRVRIVGPQYGAQKTWLLRNALTFVQPSSIEGLPIALLEALEAGRYPIVSSIPENREPVTVDGRVLGEVVEVGDEQGLARTIEAAIACDRRHEVGRELAEHVRATYNWANIASETENVYRQVVTSRRRPGLWRSPERELQQR